MSQRGIQGIYQGPPPHMVGDGFRVRGYLPGPERLVQEVSPFLLMDYHPPYAYPPTTAQRGVGAHPHRGFETVTMVYEGKVAHRDTAGNSGVIGPGEVQWMTAASGVLHEEFHEKEFAAAGGILHSVQLWVNLPAKDKMSAPRYQALTNDKITEVALDQAGSVVRLIAGEYAGVKGPALSFTPVTIFDVRLKAGAEATFSLPSEQNLFVLVAQGELSANGSPVQEQDLVVFDHAGESISLKAASDSIVLVLGGEPIREPIASYGPFVMNYRAELIQAIEDLEAGKFGVLV
ncbi:MAG: pirin family protein [Candidatus Sericytochromatia bacterium]